MRYILPIFFVIYNLTGPEVMSQTDSCFTATAYTDLDINNVKAGLLTGGDLWHNGFHDARYVVPRVSLGSTPVSSLFAGGIWIGGYDQANNLKVAARTFRNGEDDFWPGPVPLNSGYGPLCHRWDRHWKVNKTEIEIQKENYQIYNGNIPLEEIPQVILEWPSKGNIHARGKNDEKLNLSELGLTNAPFVDLNGDDIYEPVKGDYPDIKGDQAVWWIFNDYGNTHSETGGWPLNITISVMAYAFSTNDALNNTTFYHYRFRRYNTPGFLDSLYIGHWIDPDIGYAFDDEVGYVKEMNMGVGLNGDAIDGPASRAYGPNPPAIGIKILKGPEENGLHLGMSHFISYNSDTSNIGYMETPQHYYNYLSGTWKNGDRWKDKSGKITDFAGNSLPDTAGVLCNETPAERRFLMSSGPFTLNGFQWKTFDIAVVWSRCDSMWSCVDGSYSPFQCLIDDANYVQQMFDNNFPVSINQIYPVLKAEIYPVPADQLIYVNLPGIARAELQLLDIAGRLIGTYIYKGSQISINRNELSNGIYFLRILTEDKEAVLKKVIFQ